MSGYRRSASFVLLAALSFWATGAACFLHERLEHAEHASSQDPGSSHPEGDGDHPTHHGHDDCPTCLVLASLKSDSATFAPPLIATLAPCEGKPVVLTESSPDGIA